MLQTVLLKSTSDFLGGAVLDVISSIYHADHANYFILQVGTSGIVLDISYPKYLPSLEFA